MIYDRLGGPVSYTAFKNFPLPPIIDEVSATASWDRLRFSNHETMSVNLIRIPSDQITNNWYIASMHTFYKKIV